MERIGVLTRRGSALGRRLGRRAGRPRKARGRTPVRRMFTRTRTRTNTSRKDASTRLATTGTGVTRLRNGLRRRRGHVCHLRTSFRGSQHHTELSLRTSRGCETRDLVSSLLPTVSGFRETLRVRTRGRRTGSVLRKVRVICHDLLRTVGGRNTRRVRTIKGRFSPRLRRTIVRIRSRGFSSGVIIRRFRGNCGLGSEIVHPSVIGMGRWLRV